jgi:hypothetical protein
MGKLQATEEPLSEEVAAKELEDREGYIDYLFGRVMKVNLSKDTFNSRLYDRDNGAGAEQNAIDALKLEIASKKQTDPNTNT